MTDITHVAQDANDNKKIHSLLGLGSAIALTVCGFVGLLFIGCTVSGALFYSVQLFIFTFAILSLARASFCSHAETPLGSANPRLFFASIVVAVLTALLFELLTIVALPLSTPFSLDDWSAKRYLAFFALSIDVIAAFLLLSDNSKGGASLRLRRFAEVARTRPFDSIAIVALLAVLFTLFNMGIVEFMGSITDDAILRFAGFALVCVLGIAVVVCMLKRLIKLEIAFLLLSLLAGSFLVVHLPPLTGISWDDQIHYDRALGLSYLGHAEISDADTMLVAIPWAADDLDFDLVRSSAAEVRETSRAAENQDGYREVIGFDAPVQGNPLADLTTFGYFPSALGLWLGRLLGNTHPFPFFLGRFFNLLSYSIVIACAIRVSPVCKRTMMAIGLLPTSVFLASNYSYDPVVISFLMLGIALFMREYVDTDSPLAKRTLIQILLCFFIGLAPKAIYFPVVAILLLIPKTKFPDNATYRRYLCVVGMFVLFVVASFALPMLFSPSVQAGDARGGSSVSAIGQIRYILSHPVAYAGVLGRFILGYLSPVNSDMYTFFYAYMGSTPDFMPWVSSLGALVLLCSTLHRGEDEKSDVFTLKQKILIIFLFFFSVVLVCTALYVSFTAVGAETIAGVQARYLTPLLMMIAIAFSKSGNGKGDSTECARQASPQGVFSKGSHPVAAVVMFAFCMMCSAVCVLTW